MLNVGEYVEIVKPGCQYTLKGMIIHLEKGMLGEFRFYKVLTDQGGFRVFKEDLDKAKIYPKLIGYDLDTDKLLENTLKISMNNEVSESVMDLWKSSISAINSERHELNMLYLKNRYGNCYKKIMQQAL